MYIQFNVSGRVSFVCATVYVQCLEYLGYVYNFANISTWLKLYSMYLCYKMNWHFKGRYLKEYSEDVVFFDPCVCMCMYNVPVKKQDHTLKGRRSFSVL